MYFKQYEIPDEEISTNVSVKIFGYALAGPYKIDYIRPQEKLNVPMTVRRVPTIDENGMETWEWEFSSGVSVWDDAETKEFSSCHRDYNQCTCSLSHSFWARGQAWDSEGLLGGEEGLEAEDSRR